MDTNSGRGAKHPAWLSALGVGIGYVLVLVGMTVVLFLLPFVLFSVF